MRYFLPAWQSAPPVPAGGVVEFRSACSRIDVISLNRQDLRICAILPTLPAILMIPVSSLRGHLQFFRILIFILTCTGCPVNCCEKSYIDRKLETCWPCCGNPACPRWAPRPVAEPVSVPNTPVVPTESKKKAKKKKGKKKK